MFEPRSIVAPSRSLSRSIRPRLTAAIAGIVALTLAASAMADPTADAPRSSGRKVTKSRSHPRKAQTTHQAKARKHGSKSSAMRSKSTARGKAATSKRTAQAHSAKHGKSSRVHAMKDTRKSSKAPATHRPSKARNSRTQHRTTPA